MPGNVSEWCWDWYDDYPSGPETDYRGPGSSSSRVYRVGSYFNPAEYLQVGYREFSDPSLRALNVGFRVARTQ